MCHLWRVAGLRIGEKTEGEGAHVSKRAWHEAGPTTKTEAQKMPLHSDNINLQPFESNAGHYNEMKVV